MKKIILWVLCCVVLCSAKAQTNQVNKDEAQQNYEKAYAFTKTNVDSAMVWATKCLNLAKHNNQFYRAHYLRASNAKKLGMHKQAYMTIGKLVILALI